MHIPQLLDFLRKTVSLPRTCQAYDDEHWLKHDYDTAHAELKVFQTGIRVCEKRILDIGCGLGGKTVYYAEQGAEFVVGIDVSKERARKAAGLANDLSANERIQIIIADAAHLPFCGNCFDQIISTDTWEHLQTPGLVLEECERVVKMHGALALTALPYYSPWGAHTWLWLPLPWLPSLLPRRMLFTLIAHIDRLFKVNEHLPAALRLDWTNFDDPGHTRRLTVAALERSLASSEMIISRFKIIPVGARYGGIVAWLSDLLIRLPLLREMLAGIVFVTMYKASDTSRE